jgi:hypothetical protein
MQSHEEAMSALVSQHNATLEELRKEAAARETQFQGNVSRLEGANGNLTKSKESLEAEGKVWSREDTICAHQETYHLNVPGNLCHG